MLAALAALCKAAPQAVMSSSQSSSSSGAVADALMTALARKKQAYRQAPPVPHLAMSKLISQSHEVTEQGQIMMLYNNNATNNNRILDFPQCQYQSINVIYSLGWGARCDTSHILA